MNASVTIVDYGSGNLYSVARAFEHVGATVKISDDARVIAASDRVVLPGVGAFSDGMAGLRERGLVDVLRRYAAVRPADARHLPGHADAGDNE